MKKGIIYKYTFPNGKIYIGQTIDLDKRHYQHMYCAKNNKGKRILCDIAIAKYGEPKLEIIEEIIEDKPHKFKQALNEAEVKWINEYNATDRSIGYNIQNGGNTSNEETYILEEIYLNMLDEQKDKINNIREILDSIIAKVENNKNVNLGDSETVDINQFNLTKEENKVWFNLKFNERYGYETTFDELLRDWLADDFNSGGDGELYAKEFKETVNEMFDYFEDDSKEKTWKYVNQNKEKLIEEFFNDNN